MINYIVDDMDAFLDRMKQEGVKIDPKRQDESYGRFAWIYDSDGNKIELCQPLRTKKVGEANSWRSGALRSRYPRGDAVSDSGGKSRSVERSHQPRVS